VLLIHDRKCQVRELNRFLHERMGPHDDEAAGQPEQSGLRSWGRELLHRRPSLRGRQGAGQKRYAVPERFQQPPQRDGVLAGQQIRRREQSTLPSCIGHEGQGQGRHGRLAGSHVALEQPHHRPRPAQVIRDRGHGSGLVGSEPGGFAITGTGPDLLRENALDHSDRVPHPIVRYLDWLADGMPAASLSGHHADLEREQLVESQPAQGRVAGRECLRVVGILQSRGDWHE
jgi:hypothetical protein